MSGWPNLSDLIVGLETSAPVGLVGAPLAAGSVTPGGCDQAPELLRQTLRRIGRYDIETGRQISDADRRSRRCGNRRAVHRAGDRPDPRRGPVQRIARMR